MIARALVLLTAVLLPAATCAAGVFLPPVVTVAPPHAHDTSVPDRRAAGTPPPRISSDLLTRQPVAIPSFARLRSVGTPSQRTEVRLTCDANYLYIVFTCHEEDAEHLLVNCREHDGPVWRDDSVEIFLDPDNDGRDYYHLIANAAGTRYEERGRAGTPDSWDGPWYATASVGEKAWRLEAAIPFSSLGLEAPSHGDEWSANFCRNERPHAEASTWSPVIAEFAEPRFFGRLVFARETGPVVTAALPDIGAPGRYQITARVANPARDPVGMEVAVLVDGKPLPAPKRQVRSAPSGDSDWTFAMDYPFEGRHKISLEFRGPSGRVLTRTAPAAVVVPPHMSRLQKARQVVREIASLGDVRAVRRRLSGLEAFGRKARGNADLWAEFGRRLDAMEPEIAELRCSLADPRGSGYCIGTETSLLKILRHERFGGEIGKPLRISTARREFESGQAVIIAYGKSLEQIEVTVSSLTGPAGAVIPPPLLNIVGYVETRRPKYETDYVGWWPDPLMPVQPFDVAKGSAQPIWVTVQPPDDAPAGIYKGAITVRPGNAPESILPVEVRVWDFALPVEPHLRTAFALFQHEISAWYGEYTSEMKRDWYAFMLDHRLNPMNLYNKTPIPEKADLPFCVERGLNAFSLTFTYNRSDSAREELAAMIREYESYLKTRGWWDKAFIYGFDEVKPDRYSELRGMYGWVKTEFPDLPRMCTVAPTGKLKGSVDIWVPLTSNYIEGDARAFEKAGDEVWWYVCCVPHHPYPNFFIDYPAVDHRVIFWMNWKHRIPGFLYYAVNNWLTNRTARDLPEEHRSFDDPADQAALNAGKRWPEMKWNTFTFDNYNGDGHLVYPGPDGRPISSIRLECIRDGIEDYDYFAILEGLVRNARPETDKGLLEQARKLLTISDDIIGSPCDYTLDPAPITHTRQQVAEMIERLSD